MCIPAVLDMFGTSFSILNAKSKFLSTFSISFRFSGTSTMHIGLTLTYSPSVQMLRGSIIIFVAILSIAFLERRLNVQEWIGISVIFIGLLIVGAADILMPADDDETPNLDKIIIGDILVVLAQVIIALQMVTKINM